MKTIRTSRIPLRCAYDETHVIAAGQKYLEIAGVGPNRVRCAQCAVRHGVRVDESSIVDAEAEPIAAAPEPTAPPALEPEPEPEFEGEPW